LPNAQICLFYLALRGLDTVEDDMTIPNAIKLPLLRSFHEKLVTPGFTFDGNSDKEKDKPLLVKFDCVVTEMGHLAPAYVAPSRPDLGAAICGTILSAQLTKDSLVPPATATSSSTSRERWVPAWPISARSRPRPGRWPRSPTWRSSTSTASTCLSRIGHRPPCSF
jgi:hypothetical protein